MELNEKFVELIESSKYRPLNNSDKMAMQLMLENTAREEALLLSESTMAGDISQFTPILMPMVRRVYPNLIANELLGVQPMTSPTGFIYALTNRYTGDNGTAGKIAPTTKGQILVLTVDDGVNNVVETAVGSILTGGTSGATGKVVYKEGDKYLVQVTSAAFFTVEAITVTGSDDVVACTAVYTNEASFKRILKSYTGSYTTAAGEILGNDMKEVGFSISKKSVEAKTRALKGMYTLEMAQDLKAQHGLMAEEELMSLMSYEVQAEIDREVVDFVNANATQLANSSAFTASSTDGTGRWAIEKFRNEVIRISTESKNIGLNTKRGAGNIILCSPKFATMLEQVGSFKVAEQASNVVSPISGGVAGTFDGKYKVIVDQYAATGSDYCTVMYKGADRRDAMGFFAPYVPLSFQKVTNQDSGQPAVIAKTRYALDTGPSEMNPEAYARTYGVSFANTILSL